MALKATRKHRSNKAWLQEHVNDHWVHEAQRLGYRSRAAFKLIELDDKDDLLRAAMTVVDLGSAPGSWSQVLRQRIGPRGTIFALDLLEMEPVPGVTFLQGDFREDEVARALENT
ncbi:MAG TPA: RlmE family RNA methyltransferase, partial [Casimicrobiaceae bacterium]|nr:RlmE family RNA methyltransferase [Casimicrobiaceae bacterium]